MTLAERLRESWALARGRRPADGLRAVRMEEGRHPVWATLTDDDHRGILVEVGPDVALRPVLDLVGSDSAALGAAIYSFRDGERPARGLHLWCRMADLVEAFGSFCELLIARIVGGEGLQSALAACLEEFRRLVAGQSRSQLSPGAIGLLGELLVLRELVRRDPVAIDTWAFPVRERHDFRRGTVAFEVKSTLRSDQSRPVIRISAIDQLDPPPGGALFLYWVRFEAVADGDTTLVRVLADIAATLTEEQGREFTALVNREPAAAELLGRSFVVQQQQCYRVTQEFPRLSTSRLTAGRLDPGVGKVTYELDLSVADTFRCRQAEAIAVLLTGGADS